MASIDVYELWWRCLQMSRRSDWSLEVEEAFGAAQGFTLFEQWWKACEHLFQEPEELILKECSSGEELDYYRTGDGSDLGIFVNLLASKGQILTAFRKLLDERHDGVKGRPPLDDWANWELVGIPNVEALNTALDVWEYTNANPRVPNWLVAQTLKINETRSAGKPNTYDRKVLNAQVSRYKKRAERLVHGVEQGIFPAK